MKALQGAPIPPVDPVAEAVSRIELGTRNPKADLPALIGEVERLKVILTARLYTLPPAAKPQEDRLLTAAEAALKLGISKDTVYRRAHSYPFTVRMGRSLRFSSPGMDAYIRSRAGRNPKKGR